MELASNQDCPFFPFSQIPIFRLFLYKMVFLPLFFAFLGETVGQEIVLKRRLRIASAARSGSV